MSKEWQEASNEYAKVSTLLNSWPRGFDIAATATATVHISGAYKLSSYRPRRSTPSTASASPTTRARASSRAPPPRNNRWARCPEDEQGADIGAGRGWDSIVARPSESPEGLYLEHGSTDTSAVCSHDGPPAGAGVSCCSPFLSFWSTSIRKCVYPVLCYNQCISFVAIEKYVVFHSCCRRWPMCPVSVSCIWRGASGGIRNLQRRCGEPLSS